MYVVISLRWNCFVSSVFFFSFHAQMKTRFQRIKEPLNLVEEFCSVISKKQNKKNNLWTSKSRAILKCY